MLSLTLSIFLVNFGIFSCTYLQAEANYHKPKLERNNIVNKGVWVKNKSREHLFAKTSLGNFIFRTNSIDADRLLQSSFDTFAENNMDDTPSVSSYVERVRRSPDQIRKRRTRKSLNTKNFISSLDDSKSIHSKIVSSLKASSVFNEYPYEVAIVLNNNRKEPTSIINNTDTNTHTDAAIIDEKTVTEVNTPDGNNVKNMTEANSLHPKRNRKHNYDMGKNLQQNMLSVINKTEEINDVSKINRNIFDKDDRVWHQNAPIPDTNMYVVIPKDEKTKGVTERGLIKVLSMLTKTFKKIMKQHSEIKIIYDNFNNINNAFIKQANDINAKFQDFDSKYSDMIQFNDKLKTFEEKLNKEQEYLKTKHKNMEDNVIEFQNQQKVFLAQQKQFFNLQNVMLAEAEKINVKQSVIAKTQSEISYRQNNFARIFKKTKLMIDSKQPNSTDKENNLKVINTIRYTKTTDVTSTEAPSSTESVKLNLFSIPTESKLANQDEEIINEKDKKPIDDLVYKYYFNNTFIDNLMKSKFLNDYATHTNNIDIARIAKNKRGESKTTLLLPVSNNFKEVNTHNRARRWISRMQSNLNKKSMKKADKKTLDTNPEFLKNDPTSKSDPFLTMAKAFCNEIGQNLNEQMLKWCVEKSLRRLKYMDKKLFSKPATVMKEKRTRTAPYHTTEVPKVTLYPVAPSTVWLATNIAVQPSTPMYTVPNQEIFFPDNEELESNLKQYDLTPDTEGAVYFDGSAHLSDVGIHVDYENDGISDLIVGRLDDISQPEMDLAPFDIEARRRAYVIGIKQNMQRLHSRKL